MLDMLPLRRHCLLACLVHVMKMNTKDELALMFIKRMKRTHNRGRERLDEQQQQLRQKEEELIWTLSQVLECVQSDEETPDGEADGNDEDGKDLGTKIKDLLGREGGLEYLSRKTELVTRYHNRNYYPLLWRLHAPHRKVLFEVVDFLGIRSATADSELIECWENLSKHRGTRREFISDTFPLSFASKKWQAQIVRTSPEGTVYHRQMLEICLLSHLSEGLQTTDLYLKDSFQYADYRQQLLPWEECERKLPEYCLQTELPATAEQFVEGLKSELTRVSAEVDASFPESSTLQVDPSGKIGLRKPSRKEVPPGTESLKAAIRSRMPEHNLLDLLHRVNCWTDFSKNFYPVTGVDPKLPNPGSHYLFTVFGYGCNLGPSQTEKHTQNPISRRILSRINAQHIDAKKLQDGLDDIINQYATFDLAELWGSKDTAVADGTHIPLAENNLTGERHIRYGGYGGIAYHHISDTYVALFSHFISCGVWEAVYILDGLMLNKSKLNPDRIHADTQG